MDVGDVVLPEGDAGVARGTGGEHRVVPGRTLVAEDPGHADAAQALAREGVAGGPLCSLHVTVTGCGQRRRQAATPVSVTSSDTITQRCTTVVSLLLLTDALEVRVPKVILPALVAQSAPELSTTLALTAHLQSSNRGL